MDFKMSVQFETHTFGCKVNTYDSGLIHQNIKSSELFNNSEATKKVHILNTCAVTAEATKEAVKLMGRLKKESPDCLVVVTGCAAQVDTESFENVLGADLVVANSHKSSLPVLIDQLIHSKLEQRIFKSNIFKKEDLEIGGGVQNDHTRSFLKIQDGCNSFCSFCIIPYARGKSRSIGITDLSNRVVELYAQGVREVVLTGVHIGDYEDNQKTLEDLVEALLIRTPMPRFRLSSLEPIEISDRLLELYQEDRLCPHFHMSIQSANDGVLKDMKRKYGQSEVQKTLLKISKKLKNPFVGMDVIAGFPTESFEAFEDTYLALADLPWTRLHVFPYSERKGTKAAEVFKQIPYSERKARAARLRELSGAKYKAWGRSQVGNVQKALIYKKQSKKTDALTRHHCNIKFDERVYSGLVPGTEISLKLTEFHWNDGSGQDGYFEAEVVRS
jgi:threonylcarbamoyladenosine tRNA methylthiotransferase MtaB